MASRGTPSSPGSVVLPNIDEEERPLKDRYKKEFGLDYKKSVGPEGPERHGIYQPMDDSSWEVHDQAGSEGRFKRVYRNGQEQFSIRDGRSVLPPPQAPVNPEAPFEKEVIDDLL